MFATTTATVPIPMEDGTVNVVTVKKLNWKRLEEAGEAQSDRAMKKAAGVGAEMLAFWEQQAKKKDGDEPSVEDKREARYRAYDKETVLLNGVVKWTSSLDLAEGIGALDEAAAETLHRKILDMSLPPITETEAAAKKGEG